MMKMRRIDAHRWTAEKLFNVIFNESEKSTNINISLSGIKIKRLRESGWRVSVSITAKFPGQFHMVKLMQV